MRQFTDDEKCIITMVERCFFAGHGWESAICAVADFIDDKYEHVEQIMSAYWPKCETPNCPNRICTWGSHSRCYPCEENVAGKAEMDQRYNATHEHSHRSKKSPNLMTRTYAAIVN